MDESKIESTKALIASQPDRYRVLDGGAVYDLNEKRICGHLGGGYQFDSASGRKAHQRRAALGRRSVLAGLVDAGKEKGLQMPDPDSISDEELEAAGSDMLRLVIKHTALTYLGSSNLRGMSEILGRLQAPLLGPLAQDEQPADYRLSRGVLSDLADLARQVEREIETRKAIPGEVLDTE